MNNEHGWQRDLRINERDKDEPKRGTSDLLYDASGEPVSDEVWDKRLSENDR